MSGGSWESWASWQRQFVNSSVSFAANFVCLVSLPKPGHPVAVTVLVESMRTLCGVRVAQHPAHTPHSLSSLCLLCTPNTADKMLSKMLRPMSLFCVLHPVNPPNVMQQSFCGKLINFMCKQLLDFSLPCFTFPCPAV